MRCAYSSISCPAGDDVPWNLGGDIAAVIETPDVLRVMVGDVMGHGPKAGETAAEVRDAFERFAAQGEDPPQVIAARLDQLVANMECGEEFVTAQLIDIPRGRAGDGEPRIVCCGHPPPLLLSGGRATFLDVFPPSPPLGLLELAGAACPRPRPLRARAGDTMLLYTDGVTEARGRNGATYPFADRAAAIARNLAAAPSAGTPSAGAPNAAAPSAGTPNDAPAGTALVGAIRADLLAHTGGTLRDDATLMCLHLGDDQYS